MLRRFSLGLGPGNASVNCGPTRIVFQASRRGPIVMVPGNSITAASVAALDERLIDRRAHDASWRISTQCRLSFMRRLRFAGLASVRACDVEGNAPRTTT